LADPNLLAVPRVGQPVAEYSAAPWWHRPLCSHLRLAGRSPVPSPPANSRRPFTAVPFPNTCFHILVVFHHHTIIIGIHHFVSHADDDVVVTIGAASPVAALPKAVVEETEEPASAPVKRRLAKRTKRGQAGQTPLPATATAGPRTRSRAAAALSE
jgi:hypothetical protein